MMFLFFKNKTLAKIVYTSYDESTANLAIQALKMKGVFNNGQVSS